MAEDFKEFDNQFLIDARRNMTSIMDNCVYLVRGDENSVFSLIESDNIIEAVRTFLDEDPETAKRILLAALSAVRTAELTDQVSTEIHRRAARNLRYTVTPEVKMVSVYGERRVKILTLSGESLSWIKCRSAPHSVDRNMSSRRIHFVRSRLIGNGPWAVVFGLS